MIACAAGILLVAPPISGNAEPAENTPGVQDEIDRLRLQVKSQQQEIDELRKRLDAQQRLLEGVLPPVAAPASPPSPPSQSAPGSPLKDSAPVKGRLSLNLGGLTITPTGFFDFLQVWRSKTVSSGLATNFSAIPFSNTVLGNRQQSLASAANSRLGVEITTRVLGLDVLGLAEIDFRGYLPNNVATTTNTFALRMRLAFLNISKNRLEFLAGQNWSLLTPARKGISPFPDTLFLTQDLDPNVQSGLVWARTAQLRVVYHASRSAAVGFSFESGDAYAGGLAGGGAITLPRALAPNYFGQVDLSTENGNAVPNPNLDWIAKVAFDPKVASRSIHFEVAGLLNKFVFYNPLNNRRFSIVGGGAAVNAGIQILPHLTVFTNNFYTNGGGNFIFGEAPALIIQASGAPSLLPTMSTVEGLEYDASKWRFWTYYGGTYLNRISTFDPVSGQPVGYGYTGSPDSQNRTIHEITGGFTRVIWKNPSYGTLQFSAQYSWLVRHPWYVFPSQPAKANLNMIYVGFRFILPGAAEASN